MEYLEKGPILIVSDILSLITIFFSFIAKVPQIRIVIKNESAAGVSLLALLLELFSYTVNVSYNYTNQYEYMSYLEYPVLLVQLYALIYYVAKYKNSLNNNTYFFAGLYMILLFSIYIETVPKGVWSFLLPFTTPIGATSKIIQLLTIIQTKNSESISLLTWAISAFTNSTRIYTLYFGSRDGMLLTNFIISSLLSISVFLTAKHYKIPKSKD